MFITRLLRAIDMWQWPRIIKTKTAETNEQLRSKEKDKRNLLRERSLKVKVTKKKLLNLLWYKYRYCSI